MRLQVAGYGVRGAGREINEDWYCVGPFVEQNVLTTLELDSASASFRQYGLLAAVADGIGGYAGGEVASRLALETLAAQFYGEPRTGATAEEFHAALQRYLAHTQQTLAGELSRIPALSSAGATLAGIALALPDLLFVFHVGDSRVLRLSAGYVRPLTVDHTAVGPDVASGRLTEAEAMQAPGGALLQRAVGVTGDARPDYTCERAAVPGNTFLVGTDGWHGLGRGLSRRQIQEIARQHDTAATLATGQVHAAQEAGSTDDATLVVVQVQDGAGDGE